MSLLELLREYWPHITWSVFWTVVWFFWARCASSKAVCSGSGGCLFKIGFMLPLFVLSGPVALITAVVVCRKGSMSHGYG